MHSVMQPLYTAVSWIMVMFHRGFTALGMPSGGGLTWVLSIVGLVLVIRTLLIPLFVKQIKAQRALQMIQPEVKEIQQKYKHDRERQSQELMKLYKERKANPFSSCLPVIAQAPFFFALFGVLNGIAQNIPRGVMTEQLVTEARNATIFGAQLFDSFLHPDGSLSVRVVALTLVLLMTASTFLQQRQLLMKNMPAAALTGQYAQQQKILMYALPLVFGFSGLAFPIGVLVYWFTTNLWSLGQQLFVIHRMPAPGSPAEERLQQRRAEKLQQSSGSPAGTSEGVGAPVQTLEPADPPAGPKRQQPKKKSRNKRR